MSDAKRDQNSITTLLAVSNVDGETPVVLWADPTTHRLLVDLPAGAGDVAGPASSTDNAIVRFDGITGKLIQDYTSGAPTISDTGTMLIPTLTASEILATDGSKNLVSLPVATYPSLTELAFVKGVTSDIQTQLGTKELLVNKSTNVIADGSSDVKYPSVKAIKDYTDGLVTGLLDYRGAHDASGNVYPSTGGSGTAGAILKGDMYIISVAGTLGGDAIQVGDAIIANVDTPGQTSSNWDTLNTNISYVPEDVANKVTSISGASTDTQYPSAKLTYDQLLLKLANVSEDTTPELGGELDAGAHSIGFTMQTATGDGTTTVDWKLGNHMDFTFGAFNEVFTFTAPSKPGVYTMSLKQDSVGSRTATFPASVKWAGGVAPTLTTTATTGYDVLAFRFDGTNFYSTASLDFS